METLLRGRSCEPEHTAAWAERQLRASRPGVQLEIDDVLLVSQLLLPKDAELPHPDRLTLMSLKEPAGSGQMSTWGVCLHREGRSLTPPTSTYSRYL